MYFKFCKIARSTCDNLPDQLKHVIQRGSNRDVIEEEAGYQFCLEKLGDACQEFQCDLHGYVLMTNHAHLLLAPYLKGSVGKVLQTLGR